MFKQLRILRTTNLAHDPTAGPSRFFVGELWALLSCLCLLILPLTYGVRIYAPNGKAALFSFEHYLAPLAALMLLGPLLNASRFWLSETRNYLRQLLSLSVVVFAHFNLKLWAQLVNPKQFDTTYFWIDQQFGGLIAVFEAISIFLERWLFFWPGAYHDAFVGMFITSILAHAFLGRASLDRLVAAVAGVLVLGGLSYFIAPALGPFIYQLEPSAVQQAMHVFHSAFTRSAGAIYETSGFIMPLAAMPSLHVAHSFLLTWMAFRECRILGWLYLPAFIFLTTEATASGWHYLADIPAGLLVAAVSMGCNRWLASLRD